MIKFGGIETFQFLSDGLIVLFSANQETRVNIYWGVDIAALQKELKMKVDDIVNRFSSGEIFDNSYCHVDERSEYPFFSHKLSYNTILLQLYS